MQTESLVASQEGKQSVLAELLRDEPGPSEWNGREVSSSQDSK